MLPKKIETRISNQLELLDINSSEFRSGEIPDLRSALANRSGGAATTACAATPVAPATPAASVPARKQVNKQISQKRFTIGAPTATILGGAHLANPRAGGGAHGGRPGGAGSFQPPGAPCRDSTVYFNPSATSPAAPRGLGGLNGIPGAPGARDIAAGASGASPAANGAYNRRRVVSMDAAKLAEEIPDMPS
ncbi:hypothetical protein PLESTF_000243700 [Pleodorina starrii]|nr:hypothetical protein PLESTM_001378300 [Pleodorina starrii]GLC65073.1 hypothetical protein PLESTF_000243700 [Pleodorina starrii]